jgi:hypothetical protein
LKRIKEVIIKEPPDAYRRESWQRRTPKEEEPEMNHQLQILPLGGGRWYNLLKPCIPQVANLALFQGRFAPVGMERESIKEGESKAFINFTGSFDSGSKMLYYY